ncbi:MAG: autotransporter outer membrane beta-barrel domain-containing protein [Rudaea sp.]
MKNNRTLRNTPLAYAPLAAAAIFAAAHAADATSQTRQSNTPLPSLPGLTAVQQPVANAIDVVCPPIASNANPNGTEFQRLANSCSAMVVTSGVLEGQIDPSNPFNLGISNEELRKGLQASAPVQMNAQKDVTTTTSRMNLLAARLFDLRAGARGLSVSMNGSDAPAVAAASRNRSTLDGATGGAASADPAFGGRLGGFVKIAGNWGNVDRTELQDAYDYDAWSILAGLDYRVSDAFIIGGAVSYEDTHSRFDNSLGKVDAQTWSLSGYGTYTSGPWYVDGFVSYGNVSYDTTRTIFIPSNNPAIAPISGSATASPDGEQWSLALGTGYNYQMTGYTLVPFARLGYIHVKNKSFSESEPGAGLGLSVGERTLESLQSALGGTISTVVNTASGVFTPYFTAQWVHEFKNDNPSLVAKFVNDPQNLQFFIPTAEPTRDYGVFIVGASGTFANGVSGFVQFGGAAGLDNATNYSVVAGLRKEF